jgi:AraC-like DNA-binding protein
MTLATPAICSLVCLFFVATSLRHHADRRQRRLRLGAMALFLTISALWISMLVATTTDNDPTPNLALTVVAIVAGAVISTQQVSIAHLLVQQKTATPLKKANATTPEIDTPVWGKLSRKTVEAYFKDQRPWLDPQFQLPQLANALGVNRSEISAFINNTFGVNFKRYVNRWRLAEFERLMSLPSNDFKNPYKIASQAGFSDFRHLNRVAELEKNSGKIADQTEEITT